uniref:Succinate dehyrogenase subunit 4 n=1 Tax=Balbiania investiens TaxID=111861 RepID=A0A4D6BP64_9FLOR
MMQHLRRVYLSWWLVRISPLLAIFGFIYDLETLVFIQAFLILHIKSGLETIVHDYVHERSVYLFYLLSLRLLSLKLTYYILELTL